MSTLIDCIDTDGLRAHLETVRAAFERLAASIPVPVLEFPRTSRGFTGGWIIFDELWHHPDPTPCHTAVPDIAIEFGPQNWHYELQYIPQQRQFPRRWPRLYASQIEYEVDAHWQQFSAPGFPVPESRGYDFTRYAPDTARPVWAAPPPTPHHATRPATARRTTRHGRTRR